jgi:hypothetical protein
VRREVVYETEEEQTGIKWRIQSRRGWEPNRSTGKETRRVAQIALVPTSLGAGSPLSPTLSQFFVVLFFKKINGAQQLEPILFFFYVICNDLYSFTTYETDSRGNPN